MKEAILIDGYWTVDSNKWDEKIFTKEQSEINATTLINCSDCSDCNNCNYCSYCNNCSDCINCYNCNNCSYCIDCIDCSDCSYCSDFKTNPERITSSKIGSRDSQSTYYWNEDHEMIICGCFNGTLKEFENKVKETHQGNEHEIAYMNWINKIKAYKS